MVAACPAPAPGPPPPIRPSPPLDPLQGSPRSTPPWPRRPPRRPTPSCAASRCWPACDQGRVVLEHWYCIPACYGHSFCRVLSDARLSTMVRRTSVPPRSVPPHMRARQGRGNSVLWGIVTNAHPPAAAPCHAPAIHPHLPPPGLLAMRNRMRSSLAPARVSYRGSSSCHVPLTWIAGLSPVLCLLLSFWPTPPPGVNGC